ncbi:MAG: aerobic carbon-monoxide dehydrogenase large subunit [Solirubrobacterales bacterium]|jgi:carbon-monoxide dehydrogenase large subunit|nr:aerobic carbon-monoxide dehydrogenase large subunit [Solirubrobacterales bacterium]
MSTAEATRRATTGIGVAVPRKEDDRLLQGDGRFTDDLEPAHTLHMAVGRCPFPHARIEAIDTTEATNVPGVRQVLIGSEVVARTEPISVLRPVPDAPSLPFYALAGEVCVFEGQPVVSVVAGSRQIAEDAIELVEIDYEPLPHVSDTLATLEPGAPVIHPEQMDSNLLASNPQGRGEPEERLRDAATVVGGTFRIGRVTGLPMEGRAILAEWRPGARELTAHISTQVPHLVRMQLAESLRLDEGEVRIVTGDVGGGFGLKLGAYPEDVLACLHAIDTRRPVKWTEDRVEHFRATTHGREAVHEFRIGADAEGRFTAMTNRYTTDLGGQNSPFGSAQLSSIVFSGPYKVEDGHVERRVAVTNKTPIGAYRGYGQPEVNFARELLIDRLARELGRDPLQLRLQNMLAEEELPWRNAAGALYDSGDYRRCLEMAAEAVDYEALRAAGRGPREDGRHVGIGLSALVERTGYASAKFLAKRGSRFGAHESVTLRANRSGGIDLLTGVSTFGQSNETAFAQICSEVHGIDYEMVRVHAGDTRATPLNTGAFASRTLIAGAGALRQAAEQMRAKTLRIAAHRLEVEDPETLEIEGGRVVSREDAERWISLADVHTAAITAQGIPDEEEPGLEATAHFEPADAAYAFGSAAAVVSVDAETGEFDVERFVFVHDCGRVVNPNAVEGQVRGALAQGFGAALAEELRYDADTGQLVNGTMLDYFVPTASDLPEVELHHTEVPSPVTPFGVRGVGEIGTIPPGTAVANAICDALADFGVEIDRLPVTPELVWRALQDAGDGGERT